ncbi:MAG: ribulose-phosphate 3-epimerase [Ignavibacteria bacterium]|nr:ribulose-phosphate 3-epimerase [Ignavibacteria bacterium]
MTNQINKLISVSILSADFSKLGDEIHEVENAGVDMIHCDVMDGNFVPNITFGPMVVKALNKITELKLDVHLMIEHPEMCINDFIDAGADCISVHYENVVHLDRLINTIKEKGAQAGVAINPSTSVFLLKDILKYLDFVMIMSVNPGFGGQKFIRYSLDKIIELKNMIVLYNAKTLIEVDGGIGLDNIKKIADAGADILVCGNSIFKSEDKTGTIKKMKQVIKG